MILGHRIALDPTPEQERYFRKACGCARFVWNLALDEWMRRRRIGETPNAIEIAKHFNEFKYEAFPWMRELHRDSYSRPFLNLQRAFVRYFKKIGNRGQHPVFHKKGRKDSFYVANEAMGVDGKRVRLARIGWIKMRSELRFNGKIMSATVSRKADRWFISIQVEVGEYKKDRISDGIVGVDLGINSAVTLSTGEKIDAPKPLKKELRKLKRIQRKQSKQTLGGKNRQKTNEKIAKIHARCSNIRKDFWHKVSTRLCRENQAIAVEDLCVEGMFSNLRMAHVLTDVAIGMLKPMLEYKSKIYGNSFTVVDRWYPSSKTCSGCENIKDEINLRQRVYCCLRCGLEIDRDLNAAINIERKVPLVEREFMSADRAPVRSCEAENFEIPSILMIG